MQDLKTVNIKGKNYVEVNERIKYFRKEDAYKGWSLRTDIIELTDERCVLKAVISDTDGRIIAEGLAYEKAGSSFINKTSYIENCETSAWGRALGNLGIGVDASVASALEIANAINNQTQNTQQKVETKSNEYKPSNPNRYNKDKGGSNVTYTKSTSISEATMKRISALSRDGKQGKVVLLDYLEDYNKLNKTKLVASDLTTDEVLNPLIDFIDNQPPKDL